MDEFTESEDTDEQQSDPTDDEENLKAQEKKESKDAEDTGSDDSGSEDTKSDDQTPIEPKSETISQDIESLSLGTSEPTEPGDTSHEFLELDQKTQERMKEIEEAERLAEEESELKEVGIFAVKTSIGHEKMVANWLAMRAHKRKLDVYAILSPPKLRGYLLLECVKNKEALQDLIKGVQHARSVVEGTTSLDEIEHFLTPKPLVSGIEEGDVVEIIAGPFKGEKAKVTQIDESKEEITVELFEAMVSIPVTIRGDHVRILQKERS